MSQRRRGRRHPGASPFYIKGIQYDTMVIYDGLTRLNICAMVKLHGNYVGYGHPTIIWSVVYQPLWKFEFVTWDDYSHIYYGKIKLMFQTTNQMTNLVWNILVNGKDYPIYYGKIKNVWNHQTDVFPIFSYDFPWFSQMVSAWKGQTNLENVCFLPAQIGFCPPKLGVAM